MHDYIDSEIEFDHVPGEQVASLASFASHTKAEMKFNYESESKGNVVKLQWKDQGIQQVVAYLTVVLAVNGNSTPQEVMNGVLKKVSSLGFASDKPASIEAAMQFADKSNRG